MKIKTQAFIYKKFFNHDNCGEDNQTNKGRNI